MKSLRETRHDFLNNVIQSVGYSQREELTLVIAKKNVDYCFSKDFEKEWEKEVFRELHPALQDLYNQYQEMEALLKKEETK